MTEWLPFHFSLSCIGEGNGNPLQYSCLENPVDRGTWWAAVHGVTQSQTRLKWLSSSSSILHSRASQLALVIKNTPINAEDARVTGSMPESGRPPGGGHGNPPQSSCLENPIEEPGGLQSTRSQSQTRLKWLSTHMHILHPKYVIYPRDNLKKKERRKEDREGGSIEERKKERKKERRK